MSRVGSSPIVALGAGSGKALRWEDRLDPTGGSRAGTVDSVVPEGASMDGSDVNARDGTPETGCLTTALEHPPGFVQGVETAAGEVYTGRSDWRL
jgi:hypothetical protein